MRNGLKAQRLIMEDRFELVIKDKISRCWAKGKGGSSSSSNFEVLLTMLMFFIGIWKDLKGIDGFYFIVDVTTIHFGSKKINKISKSTKSTRLILGFQDKRYVS